MRRIADALRVGATPGDVFAPGTMLAGGKYRIDARLGAGGMGTVFAATDVKLRRRVAIKAMSPALACDRLAVKRFLREARSAAELSGDHTVRVFDVGELGDGVPFIAMEHLSGRDLEAVLTERGPLPFREVVDLMLQAMEGLAEAHAKGIVHRDLKPANLFLTRRSDGSALVKVLDFGLAKAAPIPDETNLTATAVVMGTQHYMSPEQLRGSRDVDTRTDIWALGVCLYQLLTGVLPFEPDRRRAVRRPQLQLLGEIARRIASETPRPPHEIALDVPFGLSQVIMRCLEKDPARRLPDVASLARALEAFASVEAMGVGSKLDRVLEEKTRPRAPRPLDPEAHVVSSSERVTERIDRRRSIVGRVARDLYERARLVFVELRSMGVVSSSTIRIGLISFGAACAVLTGVIATIVALRAHGPLESPATAVTSAAPISSETGPTPTAAGATPLDEEPTSDAAPPIASASDAPTVRPLGSAAPTPIATPRASHCVPPYVKKPDGKVIWKAECL